MPVAQQEEKFVVLQQKVTILGEPVALLPERRADASAKNEAAVAARAAYDQAASQPAGTVKEAVLQALLTAAEAAEQESAVAADLVATTLDVIHTRAGVVAAVAHSMTSETLDLPS